MPANDGGGPFHPTGDPDAMYVDTGATLRDWFAGQAVAALAHPDADGCPNTTAEWAYLVADAMLAEREKHVDEGTS